MVSEGREVSLCHAVPFGLAFVDAMALVSKVEKCGSGYVLAGQIATGWPNRVVFTGRDPMRDLRQDQFKVPESVMSISDDEVSWQRSLDVCSVCDFPG